MKRITLGLIVCFFVQLSVMAEDNIEISLLATADLHGVVVPWDYTVDAENRSGSLSQISTKVKEIRQTTPNVILVDAGDTIQGNFIETFKSDAISPMMLGFNALGYDVWALGNHEFDFGLPVLDRSIQQFKGATLAGNLLKDDGSPYVPSYKIIEKQGVKIGIVGVTTPMTAEFAKGSARLNGVTFQNPSDTVRKTINEIKDKVDALVLVSHMGVENENEIPDTGNRDIIERNPELDVVIAAHMHVKIDQQMVGNTLITEPFAYGKALSRVDLTFQKQKNRYKLLHKKSYTYDMKTVTPDPEIDALFEPYHHTLRQNANRPVAQLFGEKLIPDTQVKGVPQAHIQDSGMVALYQEASAYYAPHANVIALLISKDVFSLPSNEIREKDIAYNYTYKGGEITVYRMTGKELKAYMEWVADYFAQQREGDVTIGFNPARRSLKYSTNDAFSNVTYTIDLTQPTGQRVQSLRFASGEVITDSTPINLGMNAYRMGHLTQKGGVLEGKTFPIIFDTKTQYGGEAGTVRYLTARYLQEVKKGRYEGKFANRWHIKRATGYESEQKIVEDLLNKGIISVPVSDDGRFTNVGSINVKEKLFKDQNSYQLALEEKQHLLDQTDDEIERQRLQDDMTLIKALNHF